VDAGEWRFAASARGDLSGASVNRPVGVGNALDLSRLSEGCLADCSDHARVANADRRAVRLSGASP
jgi:hypothetical protein